MQYEKTHNEPSQIEVINEILNEIENNQIAMVQILQKNYANIMKKLMKIQEYNKINDMTNQVFEMRMLKIEEGICKIQGKL